MAKNMETPPCMRCEKTSVLTLTDAEYKAYTSGAHIQEALSTWSPAQRELLMTGTHPECWEQIFPKCTECGEVIEEGDDVDYDMGKFTHATCPPSEDKVQEWITEAALAGVEVNSTVLDLMYKNEWSLKGWIAGQEAGARANLNVELPPVIEDDFGAGTDCEPF